MIGRANTCLTGADAFHVPWANWTQEQWQVYERNRDRPSRETSVARAHRQAARDRGQLVERGLPLDKLRAIETGQLHGTESLNAVRAFLESDHVLLVLAGGRGVGKTLAATWWATRPHATPAEVRVSPGRFVDAPTLARWPRYDDQRMRQLESASGLVLDDLGLEYNDKHGAFVSLVDGLVNTRYASMLPTVITTNMRATAFGRRYGERVLDRIREVGQFVELKGQSLRGRRECDGHASRRRRTSGDA